jgi:outer membrane protein OmpU
MYGNIGGGIRWTHGIKGGSKLGFDNTITDANQFGVTSNGDLGSGLNQIQYRGAFLTGNGSLNALSTLFSQVAYVTYRGRHSAPGLIKANRWRFRALLFCSFIDRHRGAQNS